MSKLSDEVYRSLIGLQIGDKVKIIQNPGYLQSLIGRTGIISKIDFSGAFPISIKYDDFFDDKEGSMFNPQDLEII